MGCSSSENVVHTMDASYVGDGNSNTQVTSDPGSPGKKKEEAPAKPKKKGWSLFGGFKSKKPVEEPEEPSRPKPQGRWFIKELKKTRTFGSSTLATPNEWPTEEDLAKFDHHDQVKLSKVSYKRKFGGNFPLAGI